MGKRSNEVIGAQVAAVAEGKEQRAHSRSRLRSAVRRKQRSRLNKRIEKTEQARAGAVITPRPAQSQNAMAEPLDKAALTRRLSAEEMKELDRVRQHEAKVFAEAIFDICDVQKNGDIRCYTALVEALAERFSSELTQAILDSACSYYRDTYGPTLRARGYSMELVDHIVHRLGKDTRDEISTLIKGFDVAAEAGKLWNVVARGDLTVVEDVSRILFSLDNKQVREVREEYARIPAQLIAGALHETFSQKPVNREELCYALRGRKQEEIAQIEFEYDQRFNTGAEGSASFCDRLAASFGEIDALHAQDLLGGFSAEREARAVHEMLSKPAEERSYREHSRVYAEACMGSIDLMADYHTPLRINPSSSTFHQRELDHRAALEDRLACLSAEQLEEVNQVLQSRFGESLSLSLYENSKPFDARSAAMRCRGALADFRVVRDTRSSRDMLNAAQFEEVRKQFWELADSKKDLPDYVEDRANELREAASVRALTNLLRPLAYLSSSQLRALKSQFLGLSGAELEPRLRAVAAEICGGEPKGRQELLLKQRLSGVLRLELATDILANFSADARKSITREKETLEHARALELVLRQQLEKCTTDAGKARAEREILALLRSEDYLVRCALEREFYQINKGRIFLLQALEEKLQPPDYIEARLLLSGFDPRQWVESVRGDARKLLGLLDQAPDAIAYVVRLLRSEHGINALSLISDDSSLYELVSPVLAAPEAQTLERMLTAPGPLDPGVVKTLHAILRDEATDAIALEESFDRYFGRLRMRLKVLASQGKIPRKDFSELTLRLEKVRPSVVEEFASAFSATDIAKLHALLREFREHLLFVQAVYNICNPALHLRATINSLNIDRIIKNRTILLLDSFDPEKVAAELREAVLSQNGEALGALVHDILSDTGAAQSGNRIPADSNWIDEMYHQIRTTYQSTHGSKLLIDLRARDVPLKGKGINSIAFKLYGEQTKLAIDLRELLNDNNQNGALAGNVVKLLDDRCHRSNALRERVVDMYNAYFGDAQHGADLRDELNKLSVADAERDKIIKLIDAAQNFRG